jgi:hypothetical protein
MDDEGNRFCGKTGLTWYEGEGGGGVSNVELGLSRFILHNIISKQQQCKTDASEKCVEDCSKTCGPH